MTEEITDHIHRLWVLLQGEDLDLGEIQRIKCFLVKQEGPPTVLTTALFFIHR